MTQIGKRVRVKGLVQGVGFRPFVWKLAQDLPISGYVLNDGRGVLIEVCGPSDTIGMFLDRLQEDAPVLARIDQIELTEISGDLYSGGFQIGESDGSEVATGIVPDAATCPKCLAEVLNPADRRHNYAFANCTHCGPRLSILRHIPYDRASTSMAVFPMCEECRVEYRNPEDRRFHAQPIACPDCGPRLWFETSGCETVSGDPVAIAADRLRAGEILAIKGLGGFQIAVDAGNEMAVEELRRRKRRPDKPLALMARDLHQIRSYCHLSNEEEDLLESSAAPILLLQRHGEQLAHSIACGHDRLGFMLPNTPLHHLLLGQLDRPIVLTSGNLSESPQETVNDQARRRLKVIVDGFLLHDREIVNRLDDSVLRLDGSGPTVLRRARGLAPAPIHLSQEFADAPKVLAMGGELKSAFCLLNGRNAVLSQHIGDLEDAATFADYKKMLRLYCDLYQFCPQIISVDCHPQYLSTAYGKALAKEFGAELDHVQHHHAHMAACLAEQQDPAIRDDPAFGLILDGLGWGEDGTVWGGEILKGDLSGFNRLGHFHPVPLPGGNAAVREPWRNLAAHLHTAFGPGYLGRLHGTRLRDALQAKPLKPLDRMIERSVNASLSSSAGRLFDSVAAALGIGFDCQSYEGQAAMLLEALARPHMQTEQGYPYHVSTPLPVVISFQALWMALIGDLKSGVSAGRIAARFHLGLIDGLVSALEQSGARSADRIVLSGGVFQNAILRDGVTSRLKASGHEVRNQTLVPANDGGLALGQAVVAAARHFTR
ncbi:carbamoyltransferase HypF [Roseibium sp. SCPC15]|uniref:carbamoyltransferase HypF n=1 Tax=Roseibium sp. SCP15 TaxID=3141376 RepID=UPI003338D677